MENDTNLDPIGIHQTSTGHVTEYIILALSSVSIFLCLCSAQKFCSWKAWTKFWWIQAGLGFHAIGIPIFSIGMLILLGVSPLSSVGAMVTLLAPPTILTCPLVAILDCDVTLAAVITVLATLLSAGVMPLWIMNLKRFDSDLEILQTSHLPYDVIGAQLTVLLSAVLLAVFLRRTKPHLADLLSNGTKPMAFLTVLFALSYHLYTTFWPLPNLQWKEYLFCFLQPSLVCLICFVTSQFCELDGSSCIVLAFIFLVRGSIVCTFTFQRGLPSKEEEISLSTSNLLTIFSILFILVICLLNLARKACMPQGTTHTKTADQSQWDVWAHEGHMIVHSHDSESHDYVGMRPAVDVKESFNVPYYWSWV